MSSLRLLLEHKLAHQLGLVQTAKNPHPSTPSRLAATLLAVLSLRSVNDFKCGDA